MIGLKRSIPPGFVISVIGHVTAVALGLLFVGANAFKSPPPEHESVPPDAMVVDIVPQKEAPRLEGTPSDLRSSGSEVSSRSNSASAAAQPPPPEPSAQSPQQLQGRSNPQHNARQASAHSETSTETAQPEIMRAKTGQPETIHAETRQPETGHADTAQPAPEQPEMAQAQTSQPRPAPPQPGPVERPDQPDDAKTFTQLALLGGPLGGGFDAPPINAAQAGYDFTAPFRERVSSCSTLPPGIDPGDKIGIVLRVFLNPDGTLASPPQSLAPITSAKQLALVENSIHALQKCQPYTMLPADKYMQWKTLDLIFYPRNFLG